MSIKPCEDRKALQAAIEELAPGDCVQIGSFSEAAGSAAEMLSAIVRISEHGADLISLREEIDTRGEGGAAVFALCRALYELDRPDPRARRRDGVERAKAEGRYRGRKPIAVDEGLFDSVVELWQSGQISARQAMARLELKPNTFYRRIKEREEQKMKDYKKVEHELRDEVKEAARQSRRDLDELKKQVKAEAEGVRRSADEKLELHDVEKELRKDRIRAEMEHRDSIRQMKKDVEAEARELKKVLDD